MKLIKDIITDEERSFYGIKDAHLINIKIVGPKDGESSLKEAKNIIVEKSVFSLRYPFWHNDNLQIKECEIEETGRAAIWYSNKITIEGCKFNGVKILRECNSVNICNTDIISTEPFWYCKDINIIQSSLQGEYAFLNSKNINITDLKFKGKYSFQYVSDVVIKDSYLDTKDAFWGSNNVTVYNSTVKGEYLGWYAKNLKLINCTIIGTQPLCYCDNLVLENCEMIDTDFSFEYSTVKATINNEIISVKNPISGYINAKGIKEIILDDNQKENSDCMIIISK